MSLTISHKKVSTIPDGSDPTQVLPSDWNDTHQIAWGFATPNTSVLTSAHADTPGDPYWNNTVLMLHFDGSLNSTTIPDTTGKTVTSTGVTLSNTYHRFGGMSGAFSYSGHTYLTIPSNVDFDFRTGDFTLEAWILSTAATGVNQMIMCHQFGGISFYLDTNMRLAFAQDNVVMKVTGTTTLNSETWYHVAATRSNKKLRIFVNGIQEGSDVLDYTDYKSTSNMIIGAGSPTQCWYSGAMDELRITKGVARYTSNFNTALQNAPFYDVAPSLTFTDGMNYHSAGTITVQDLNVTIPSNSNWVIL